MSIIQGEPQLPVAAPSLPQPSVAPSVPIGSHFLPMGQPLPTSMVPQFSVSQLPIAAPHVSVAQPGFQSLPISMPGGMNQPLLTLATSAAATAIPVGSTVVPSQLPTLMQPVAQLPSQVLPQLLQPAVQSVGLPVSIGQAAEASLPAGDALYQVLLQASRALPHPCPPHSRALRSQLRTVCLGQLTSQKRATEPQR